jgi:hypothetical protein
MLRNGTRILARVIAGSCALLAALAVVCLPPTAQSAKAATSGLTKGEGTGTGWCTEYGTNGAKALVSYENVWGCGPDSTIGPTPFDSNGTESFQCVELSERFLWAIYGLPPIFGSNVSGASLVSVYHSAHQSIPVGNPGPSSLPQPGDVISLSQGGEIYSSSGHTAVVVSAPNSAGNFTIMSQNWANTAGDETAHIDLSGAHNGHVQLQGSSFWNSAQFLETALPYASAPNPISVSTNADGRLEVFGVNAHQPDGQNNIYHSWQLSPGGDWSQWYGVAGYLG